jgi:RNA polymerase-binding protein DksA
MAATNPINLPRVGFTDVLTPEQINQFRERLERERAEIQSRIAARNREVEATLPPEEEIGDEGDEAKVVTDLDPLLAENELDRETLEQIESALQRIEEGTYGISEVSGKAIPIERLEAVPYATTLVDEQLSEPN